MTPHLPEVEKELADPVLADNEVEPVVEDRVVEAVEEVSDVEPVVEDVEPVQVQAEGQGRDLFKCKKTKACKREFRTRGGLMNHIEKNHKDKKQFQCKECGKSFPKMQRLAAHQETHVVKPTISCDICGQEVKNMFRLKQHSEKYHDVVNAKCDICDQTFLYKIELRNHRTTCLKKENRLKTNNLKESRDNSTSNPPPDNPVQEPVSFKNKIMPSNLSSTVDPEAHIAENVELVSDDTYAVVPSQDILCLLTASDQEQPVTFGILSFEDF